MADLYTDEDGWHVVVQVHGQGGELHREAAAYNLSQSVTLKANGYLSVPFTTP